MENEDFIVRLQESFQIDSNKHDNREAVRSTESLLTDRGSIQQILKKLQIEEEKKFIRKTQDRYTLTEATIQRKKTNSQSISKIRQSIKLPLSLSRVLHSYKNCPNISTNDVINRVYGAFLGFLIGDSVGAHLAHRDNNIQQELPSALLMKGGGTYNLGPAQGTDQTEICFTTAYGLIEGKGVYDANIMSLMYLQWIQSKPFDLPTLFVLSLNEIKRNKIAGQLNLNQVGQLLKNSSKRNLKHQSNLGLIRLIPLVIWSLKMSQQQTIQLVKNQMLLISPNELVIETSIVYSKILRTIILTGDHQLAFYQASKWVYDEGSQKIMNLWSISEKGFSIPSKGNMGKLKTAFTYSITEINKNQINFLDSLINMLAKGGETDSNCAIVMGIVGATVGYNRIPNYFKNKISNYKISQSSRPRKNIYWPSKVFEITSSLLLNGPTNLVIK